MLHRKMIAILVAAASLSLGLPLTMSAAYAAPAAPATHSIAGVPAQANAPAAVTWRDCTNSNSNRTWVHLDIITSAGYRDYCYGGAGKWYFFGYDDDVRTFCSGNNEGLYYYYDHNGKIRGFSFKPGKVLNFVNGERAYELWITGWSGNFECPYS